MDINRKRFAVVISSINLVCYNMAQQTTLPTLATLSVGVGLRSVNRKLRSLCAVKPRVRPLVIRLLAPPATVIIIPPDLSGFQPTLSFRIPQQKSASTT